MVPSNFVRYVSEETTRQSNSERLFHWINLEKIRIGHGIVYSLEVNTTWMVKYMFSEAKIIGIFTNHSLRATGANELFQLLRKLSKESLGIAL